MSNNLNQPRTELLQRCMARLQEDITIEERIKILRIMASTAQTMINDLEDSEVTTTA
jgi:hypothetical protein